MKQIKNYIGGELVGPKSGRYADNYNPATGEVYSQVPLSSSEDATVAIEVAKNAFPAWAATPTVKRVEVLRKIAQLIRDNRQELAKAETIDNGKPIKLSTTVDIPRAYKNLEFFADAVTQFSSDTHVMDEQAFNYTLKQPLGVVTCISPWNFPLYLLTWKVAPALAVGNTVIAKPSEVTPMTAYMFSELCIEAGLPPGVLNIIHGTGDDLGETITTHPDIEAVSFTGSTATGKKITENASPLFKKVGLEMGGKNPNIVFSDCKFDEALKTAVQCSFANQGQICLCGSRTFVEESIYNKFRDGLVEGAKKLLVGDPMNMETQQGAVVSKEHHQKIISYLELAKKEGGKILCGGGAAKLSGKNAGGYFVEPTVIENLDHKCRTNQEEIFGPVTTITPFKREEEAIEMANSTSYGLSASVWTQDVDRGHRVCKKIQSGVVWLNSWLLRDLRIPFGGMKSSGMGREGGQYSLNFFTETKNICVKVNE